MGELLRKTSRPEETSLARAIGNVGLAIFAALLMLEQFARPLSAQDSSGKGAATPAAATPSRAMLELGNSTRAGGGVSGQLAIPLQFTAPAGESVGRIRAEVTVPKGPWKFQKVVLPKDAWWRVSTREREEEIRLLPPPPPEPEDSGPADKRTDAEDAPAGSAAPPGSASTATRTTHLTVLELTFNAGSRLLPNGLIGTLMFSLRDAKAQPPAALVRKLETYPTEAEAVSNPEPLPLPEEIPTAAPPVVGCFFFTH